MIYTDKLIIGTKYDNEREEVCTTLEMTVPECREMIYFAKMAKDMALILRDALNIIDKEEI